MPAELAAVDTLIRDLGAAVSAAAYVRGRFERSTADEAIRKASDAVYRTVSAPEDPGLLARARDAVQTAQEVILALDEEVARSRALGTSSAALRGRALELIEQARLARGDLAKATPGPRT
jgi:hypothetical protein